MADASYLDLLGIRSNPMVDADRVPLAPRLLDWLATRKALVPLARPVPPVVAEIAAPDAPLPDARAPRTCTN